MPPSPCLFCTRRRARVRTQASLLSAWRAESSDGGSASAGAAAATGAAAAAAGSDGGGASPGCTRR
jgi:hypothetical protein